MGKLKDPIALRMQIRKVIGITILWMIIGSMQFWYEVSILLTGNCGTGEFNVWSDYPVAIVSTGFAGIVGGSVVVFFFERWIRIWPYWKATVGILVAYSIVYVLVNYVGFGLRTLQMDIPPEAGGSKWQWFRLYLGSVAFVRGYVVWIVVVLLTLLGLIVYDKYGPGTLGKLLVGKYFRPKAEERVFMFLDLRSSTEIAEKLGETQYFRLLRDVIQDVTTPILTSKGEIYQYVGDEIIVSWTPAVAQQNANCLICFFSIRDAIRNKSEYYLRKYGLIPEYKAGLHYGNVIAGEIGVVKRDITYTGDVLNTTSRIQSKCNELGVDILLSKHLLDFLKLRPGKYEPQMIGAVTLRGKSRDEMLYTV